jgi:hypothetical protein
LKLIHFSVRDADETLAVGSHDSGNGFDLNNDDQAIDLVLNFIRKFIHKICDESGVHTTHKNSLHTKLYRMYISSIYLVLLFFLFSHRNCSNSNRNS